MMFSNNTQRRIAVAVSAFGLLTLGACASPARPEAMGIMAGAVPAATASDIGYRGIHVASVQGGGDTNPLWMSNVSNTEFKAALENSLRALDYLSSSATGPLTLTATLVDIQRPLAGLDLTTTTQVRYSVVDQSGRIVFDETIAATGTARFGDSLLAVERLRMANEASVRENITAFVQRFRAEARR